MYHKNNILVKLSHIIVNVIFINNIYKVHVIFNYGILITLYICYNQF